MDSGGCSAFILFTTQQMRVLGLPGLHLPMLKPTNPVLRWSQQSLTQIEMLVHRDILLYHNSRRQDFYLPDCGSFCYRTCMVIDLDSKFIHHFGQKTTSLGKRRLAAAATLLDSPMMRNGAQATRFQALQTPS